LVDFDCFAVEASNPETLDTPSTPAVAATAADALRNLRRDVWNDLELMFLSSNSNPPWIKDISLR
jgi:hypothetical protein